MKVCILMGSPRREGNTEAVTAPFAERLRQHGAVVEIIRLYEKEILPCVACRYCQSDWEAPRCRRNDDMTEIFESVLACDLLVLASPIYAWYCTAPMKTALDRMIYALCKYYGDRKGPSLWKGKPAALITTCGYPVEKGADIWEAGMKRYCRHAGLRYLGIHAERHLGYTIPFMDEEKRDRASAYADELWERVQNGKE